MGRTGNVRTVKRDARPRKAPQTSAAQARRPAHADAAITLLMAWCAGCGFTHPKPKAIALPSGVSPFLTPAELGLYLGKRLSTIYSEKSRGTLPPTLARPGNPRWDPCVVARWLHTGVATTNAQPLQGGTR